ncbi:hypothetical protein FACS1894105_10480 [Clostridia bacterium]|nr:hypothetical protein FACS1894105_10480 [Clostridia bacterium]
MPRGGARPGAGRPKKPLADKIIEGNPGKRDIMVLKFNPNNSKTDKSKKAKLPTYLDIVAKEGNDDLPKASEIYTMFANFIEQAGCLEFVTEALIEDFAFLRRAYLECEVMNRKIGRIVNGGKRSPYVSMALDYQKSAMAVYIQIWQIVAQNSETKFEGGGNAFLDALKNRGY